jgi:hypothetical protein
MATTFDLKPLPADPEKRHELMLKVYGATLDEYRFNVQLAWDRTKFFIVVNSGLIGAGVGLFKIGDAATEIFLIPFFLLSMVIAVFGLQTVAIGKNYYRESIFKKTLIENELGLLSSVEGLPDTERATLSIAVTDGQRNYRKILLGEAAQMSSAAPSLSLGTISGQAEAIFWMMIAIEALGAAIATALFVLSLK